ncbi:MAG: aromatic ring-opening dioxygenase LigA [Nitriliruptoraceae bacterium]
MTNRKLASVASIVLGALLIVGSIGTWVMVSSTLADQRITTPSDACLPERDVRGPFTAYCQARIIEEHALNSTDGLTYAELDREDPLRNVAMNASFLQASLFTSVLAFGVAAMAGGMGLIFILIGLGMRDVSENLAQQGSSSSS